MKVKLFGLLKRAWILLLLTYTLSNNSNAQCHADFTYSIDSINGTVTFTNLSVTQDTLTPVLFMWYSQPSVPLSSDSNPVLHFAPGIHHICLKVSNDSCSDSTCTDITMPEVFCKAAFTWSVDQDTRTASFVNASTGVNLSYYWSFADGLYSTQQSPSHTFVSNGWYYVCLNIINSDSTCDSFTCDFVRINKSSPTPCSADFIYEYDTANAKLIHFYNATVGDTGITYLWLFSEVTSSQENPSYQFADTGFYTVCLLVSGPNCADSICKTVEISQNVPICDAVFTYNLYPDSGNNAGRIAVFHNASAGNDLNYTWNFGDRSASSSSSAPFHYYPVNGQYTVCLTAYNLSNACFDSVCTVITIAPDSLTGIKTADFQLNNINVYPIPFTDMLTVDFMSTEAGMVRMNIYDVIGRLRYTENSKTGSGPNHVEMSVSGLGQGLYFLEIQSGDKTRTVRIIK